VPNSNNSHFGVNVKHELLPGLPPPYQVTKDYRQKWPKDKASYLACTQLVDTRLFLLSLRA